MDAALGPLTYALIVLLKIRFIKILLLISWQEQCYPERMKIRPTNIMAGSVTLKG